MLRTLVVCLFVGVGVYPTTASRHGCSLLPSLLGPDWYMVPLPIPTQFLDVPGYPPSYVHMPCAITTVFDEGICGCTNLAAYMYRTVESKMAATNLLDTGSNSVIKQREPTDYSFVPKPVGSLLLNTRTGKVTECPFKGSPRGGRWYLVREPSEKWMNMKCAKGTVFSKITCSCQHAGVTSATATEGEDDIIVLEHDHRKDNKISASLNIKLSDIDFRSPHANRDTIPFWRQAHLPNTITNNEADNSVKADVVVTGTVKPADTARVNENQTRVDRRSKLGKLLKKTPQTSPLVVDFMETHVGKQPVIFYDKYLKQVTGEPIWEMSNVTTTQHNTSAGTAFKNTNNTNTIDGRDKLGSDTGTDLKVKFLSLYAALDTKDSFKKGTVHDSGNHITHECAKKPIPELGPDYFQMYIWEVGYVPYRCHVNRIYDDLRCACVPASSTTECAKKPIPELGPDYFQMYVWGAGYIPYRCHGNRVYDDIRCACVPST